MKRMIQDLIISLSKAFGQHSAAITRVRPEGVCSDPYPFRGVLYVSYPKWMWWMSDTEEKIGSNHGVIWFGEFSGRLDTSTNRWLNSLSEWNRMKTLGVFDDKEEG